MECLFADRIHLRNSQGGLDIFSDPVLIHLRGIGSFWMVGSRSRARLGVAVVDMLGIM